MNKNQLPDPDVFWKAADLMVHGDWRLSGKPRYCCVALTCVYALKPVNNKRPCAISSIMGTPEYELLKKLYFTRFDTEDYPWRFSFMFRSRRKALERCARVAQCMRDKASKGAVGDPLSWGCG